MKHPPSHPPPHPQKGIATGSGKSNETKVGQVTKAQVEEIAKKKLPDTNATKLQSACKMIEGTARSLGLVVVD
jgi:large subunit ribosomal protein L11